MYLGTWALRVIEVINTVLHLPTNPETIPRVHVDTQKRRPPPRRFAEKMSHEITWRLIGLIVTTYYWAYSHKLGESIGGQSGRLYKPSCR